MVRNLPFVSNTWKRWWPRSTTKSRPSLLMAMLWTVFHSFGPGLAGSFGFSPQSIRNLPSLSNFATRVPPYPSLMKNVPSGSQSMSVGRSNSLPPSRPRWPLVPSVIHQVAVVRELVDHVQLVVDHPDVLVGDRTGSS